MFRLIRALIALVVLIALAYVAVFVPLGDKPLWQHLRAIAQTDESKDLVKGVKKKATEVLRDQLESEGSSTQPSEQPQPQDGVTEQDKARLRKLLREKLDD